MKRKIVKLILFIFGAAVLLFWTVIFFMSQEAVFSGLQPFWDISTLGLAVVALVAIVPMSIAMLIHAKDIKDKKKGFANFLTIFSIIWLAGGALNITIMVAISLIFGWHVLM